MTVYERATRISAPLSDVWAFHSTIDGLEALTPSWLDLRVEGIERADRDGERPDQDVERPDQDVVDRSDPTTDVLEAGTRIRLSTRPFGVGPTQRWTTTIERREEGEGVAYFVDSMTGGPFPEWRHVHLFYDAGDETLLRDRVTYEPPGQLASLGPLVDLGFEAFFRYRHRRTREIFDE